MNVRSSFALELLYLERYDQAITELDKVAKAFPDYAAVYANLSRAHRARGSQAAAEHFAARAATLRDAHGVTKPPLVFHPRVYGQ